MHNGSLLIDMHVHLAQYEVLSASTRDWFISLYPSEAAYQAVCEANASPDDFCAMLAEKGVDYAVILAEDTPAVTGVADNRMVADFCKGHPQLLPFCTFDPLKEKDMPGQLRQLRHLSLEKTPETTYFLGKGSQRLSNPLRGIWQSTLLVRWC